MNRPNLLYIHTDQHTPFVTGCYGDPLVRTPNLDRLAAGGARFDQVYCASPICVPSRMSMLTARHPHHNRVWTNNHILDSAIPTHAHAMGAVGYQPTLIGRMHSVGPDQLHGYAQRLVGDHSPNYIGGGPGVDRGILDGTSGPHRMSLIKSGPGLSGYQVHDEVVTAATVNVLNELGVQKRINGQLDPFSITVGFMLPHAPFAARRAQYDYYRERMTLPKKNLSFAETQHPYLRAWRTYTELEEPTPDEMVLRARAAYWGMVEAFDAMIGQILDALYANGLAENTLIVYTSDHGDMVGEHGLWWKHVFYEESVRVPLIMHWPEAIAAGQRCDCPISAVDVTATMLDALGAPALPNSDGRSFLGLVSDRRPTPDWADVAFSEYCADQYTPGGSAAERQPQDDTPPTCFQRMVRQNIDGAAWKLIYYHGDEPQLFNLSNDPDELHDLAQSPAHQAVRQQLTARVLDGWDPDEIAQIMAAKRAENKVLAAWARHTHPVDNYRWDLRPEMNRLEDFDPSAIE
ncbi:MAG: sulfatase-like hydrolase/transferase [Caldilineaceae bacterium]|nr:sulfatase-like hydrolase/transferase [Caldilineaceae bacterium]